MMHAAAGVLFAFAILALAMPFIARWARARRGGGRRPASESLLGASGFIAGFGLGQLAMADLATMDHAIAVGQRPEWPLALRLGSVVLALIAAAVANCFAGAADREPEGDSRPGADDGRWQS